MNKSPKLDQDTEAIFSGQPQEASNYGTDVSLEQQLLDAAHKSRVELLDRRLPINYSDLVVPFCCSICLHLFYFVIFLVIELALLSVGGSEISCSVSVEYQLYTMYSLMIHGLTLCLCIVSLCSSYHTRIFEHNKCLQKLLQLGLWLNVGEMIGVVWSLFAIFLPQSYECMKEDERLLFNLSIVAMCCNTTSLALSACLWSCFSSKKATYDEFGQSQMWSKRFYRCCHAFFWDKTDDNMHNQTIGSSFDELGLLVTMLQQGTTKFEQEMSFSDLWTGLQLLRMLQKYYGWFDELFFHPYIQSGYFQNKHNESKLDILRQMTSDEDLNSQQHFANHRDDNNNILHLNSDYDNKYDNDDEKHDIDPKDIEFAKQMQLDLYNGVQPQLSEDDQHSLREGQYWVDFACAAYGIGLQTLTKPCAVCCNPMCGLPHNLRNNDNVVIDVGVSCMPCDCGCRVEYSDVRVFLRNTATDTNDLLLANMAGGKGNTNIKKKKKGHHVVTHYVSVDRKKKAVVITIRGTMSMANTITDGQCIPVRVTEIPLLCWCHAGIYLTAQKVLQSLNRAENVIDFLENNKDYALVFNGHSLGAGVSVVLAEFLKHGSENVFHSSYKNRPFRAFAFAPPPLFDEHYCRQFLSQSESYLCTFIYSKDMVPRLSWRGVVKIRAAIPRLLQQCKRTQWW
ncbi:hypothetical protein RFI_04485, partial [Reticulomyxa filosa]